MDWDAIESWLRRQRTGFCNGRVVLSPAARVACRGAGVSPYSLLVRHLDRDDGQVAPRVQESNRRAVDLRERELFFQSATVSSLYPVGNAMVVVETQRHAGRTRIMLMGEP